MLSEYIDDAVSPGDRTAIEEHLKSCETCSAALKELTQTVAHIRSVQEIEPPAWLAQKIMAQVRAESEKKGWFQRFFVPLHIKLPLEAIGVLFIAVTALFIYQNRESIRIRDCCRSRHLRTSACFCKNDELRISNSSRVKDSAVAGYKALT
jgi:predicted anti-sigma-YlaC factor YlaD